MHFPGTLEIVLISEDVEDFVSQHVLAFRTLLNEDDDFQRAEELGNNTGKYMNSALALGYMFVNGTIGKMYNYTWASLLSVALSNSNF